MPEPVAAPTSSAPPAPPPPAAVPPASSPAPTSLLAPPAAGTGAPGTTPPAPSAADIEIKLPEGVVAGELLNGFKPLAKELGLTSENAQKFVDLYLKSQGVETQKAEAKAKADWDQHVGKMQEAAKADKEFGGKDFDANLKTAVRAVEKFGGKELQDRLAASGLGNDPAVIRAFWKIGKAMAEDSVAGAGTAPATQNTEEARLRAMYPTMFSKKE